MATKAFTTEKYEALLNAFREEPGNINAAAKKANTTWATADKAWRHGWANKPWGRAISLVLKEEMEAARAARIQEEKRIAREELERMIQARLDAIEARKEEAQGAKVSRKNAILMAVVSNRLLSAADKIAVEIQNRVNAGVAAMPLADLRKLMEMATRAVSRSEQVMRMAVELERIIAGEPIAIVGVRSEKMTPEQMVESLRTMERTMARAGALAVLTEGDTDDPPAAN
jgi:hypothetical protein